MLTLFIIAIWYKIVLVYFYNRMRHFVKYFLILSKAITLVLLNDVAHC